MANGNFCSTNTKTWVWELVAAKTVINYGDWAYMESPFQLRQAFGADGIGFQEYDKDGLVTRCTRFESFTPWRQSDLTNLDLLRDNQWSREEKSLGPRTAIRPVVNDSNSFSLVYDFDKVGVLCFYDKLFVAAYSQYITNNTGKMDFIDWYYDFMFVPREVSRMDYLQHLIGRVQCNPKPCIKQSFKEWPCITNECHFSDPKDDDLTSEEDVVWYKNRKGEEIKLKKKDIFKDVPEPKPCFNVCQDKVCPPPSVVCKEYIDNLAKCNESLKSTADELKRAQNVIIELKREIKADKETISDLQVQLGDAKQNLSKCNDEKTAIQKQLDTCNIELEECKKKCEPGSENTCNDYKQSFNNQFLKSCCFIVNAAFIKMGRINLEDYDLIYSNIGTHIRYLTRLNEGKDAIWRAIQKIIQSLDTTNQRSKRVLGLLYSFLAQALYLTTLGSMDDTDFNTDNEYALRQPLLDENLKDIGILMDELFKDTIEYQNHAKQRTIDYYSKLTFFLQQAGDKKERDSGNCSETFSEENQESGLNGSSPNAQCPTAPPFPEDQENDPCRMEDEDEITPPTQG